MLRSRSRPQYALTQTALAPILARGGNVVPIPGSKRIDYLNLNIGATNIGLTPDDLQELHDSVPPDFTSGSRYPGARMWMVDL